MCILTEPKFYPKNEYNEKAAVNFLVYDTSFFTTVSEI